MTHALRVAGIAKGENPLASDSPQVWYHLIEAVGPASLLVSIESRMSAALRTQLQPEDVLQDALLCAWRSRATNEWRGLRCFRSWLLTVIDTCIRAAADYAGAQKRGGGRPAVSIAPTPRGSDTSHDGQGAFDPWYSTTPSRLAVHREQAAIMQEALAALPDDLGPAVRMRLVEQLPVAEIAARMQIGEAAVRHRVRKGTELYRRRLQVLLTSRTGAVHHESAPD